MIVYDIKDLPRNKNEDQYAYPFDTFSLIDRSDGPGQSVKSHNSTTGSIIQEELKCPQVS